MRLLNLLGLLVAVAVACYTTTYAWHVWRRERNPFGAVGLALLALSVLALPIYILYFKR